MSLKICGHLFYGPFKIDEAVIKANHVPVVFAIIAREGKPWDPSFRLLDIGFSSVGGLVIANHPARTQWDSQAQGPLGVYFLDVGGAKDDQRQRIADDIRQQLNPPEGVIQIHAI